jgi:magnesium chelatase subunit I
VSRPPVYPFSAIVGQEPLRTALLLGAVDPSLGGLLVRGTKGTGKSTAVRGLGRLLPAIEVVAGCPFHCAPDAPSPLHEACAQALARGERLPSRTLATPLVELPLNATEDRLVGTLQIEHALRTGERRFEPGLLAAAHRGLLYVDEVNLLEDHLVDLLLDVAASGVSVVERDGLSVRHAAELLLVGTMNPEQGELRPQFLDRFGLCAAIHGIEPAAERQLVIRRRLAFERDAAAFNAEWAAADGALATRVIRARQALQGVRLPDAVLAQIVDLAARAKTLGHRAELAMVKAARALAALLDRDEVGPAEVAEAARYALPHRLHDNPLSAPEGSAERIETLLGEVLGPALRRAVVAGPDGHALDGGEGEDPDEAVRLAEAMQVPGGMAAGSILFVVEKKSSQNGSSTPTRSSA